ncbi:MAG: choice-of-anchor Q domain-containing protein [Dehalococcoidia bacterium]
MTNLKRRGLVVAVAVALAVGLAVLAWVMGAGGSEGQQGSLHNCPQPGKWAISVWEGADSTDIGQALATCGEEAVYFAYYLDPDTQNWLRYLGGRSDISNLLTLNDMQGVLTFRTMETPATPMISPTAGPTETATVTTTPTSTPPPLTCSHHVSPGGNDGDAGTAQAPWRTIQHAADTAQPGDTVCVHGGSYSEEVTFSRSGTAGAPVTFGAAPGETPTVQGSLTLAAGTSYVNLIGFVVGGFPVWGVTLLGDNHHVLLSHLDVSGGEASVRFTVGYSEESPQHGPVSDVILEDSVLHDCAYEAVDCTPGPCDRMTFRRLEVYGAGTAPGADFGGDGLSVARGRDIVVEDSFIHDNGGDGIDLNSRDSAGNVPGIVVRRNLVVRNHLQGIKLWAGGRMENNVVWGQGINPVMVGAHPGVYQLVNNTIAYNMYSPDYGARDYALVAAYPEDGASPTIQLTLVNNIFAFNTGPAQGSPTGIYLGEGVQLTEHHNLYWSREDGEIQAEFVSGHDPWFSRADIADGTWMAVTGQGQGDVTADPLFVSGWSGVNLHLQAGSPAVNAGSVDGAPSVDAEGRPRVGTPDIGAYER